MELKSKPYGELLSELEEVKRQLYEANETIEAIRTGQVDALMVEGTNGHQLFTLKSADVTYRVFIEKMTEGAVTLSNEGLILYCNSQFASMVARPISSVIGYPFEDFINDATRGHFQEQFKKCWDEDCKGEVILKADDHEKPVLLSLTALELEDDVSLSVIVTDLSTLKLTQEKLEENNNQLAESNHALELSNHDLQQFASVASHDLQEPLRKIQMFSELLKVRASDQLSPESQKYLSKITVSAERMKKLVLDILNYSKLSARTNLVEKVDLNILIKELLEDLELVFAEKQATITVDPLPVIDVNRGQIRQVFQNIISNAIKFSREDVPPVIHISCKTLADKSFDSKESASGGFVLISVSDNGIGFESRYLDNIFVLFERLHSKDAYEGTGIGLAISKKIIEKHNGLITAKSISGKGSTFLFILPLSPLRQ
ncbi:sensor histidine kinase [Flavitalea sp.]|nr:ATP-binding protein [Flavitalea sp.]